MVGFNQTAFEVLSAFVATLSEATFTLLIMDHFRQRSTQLFFIATSLGHLTVLF